MSDATINELLPHEIALLNILVWLAPTPIPRYLLISTNAETIWQEIGKQQFAVAEPISSLSSSVEGLVRRNVVTETVTPDEFCVCDGYRQLAWSRQEQPNVWLMWTLSLLNSMVPVDNSEPEWERLYPHIMHATRHGDFHKISEPTSELMSALSGWLISMSNFKEAEPLQRRALQFDDCNYGSHSMRSARCCKNLAHILSATTRPFEANLYSIRAAAIENCFDADEALFIGRHEESNCEPRIPNRFWRSEFLSRTKEEVLRHPIPVSRTLKLHPDPPRKNDCDQDGDNPTNPEEPSRNEPPVPNIVEEEPVEKLFLMPSLYPPLSMEGIPRCGRILFAYRCLLRSTEPLDCLGNYHHRVEAVISNVLNDLLHAISLRPPRFPPRWAVEDCIRDCVRVRKSAAQQMEFDRSVAIQNVVRFLVTMDYAIGVVRAMQRETSIIFAELVASTSAITNRHRQAQQFDLRSIRNAAESDGAHEGSTLPHDLLGELWPDDIP